MKDERKDELMNDRRKINDVLSMKDVMHSSMNLWFYEMKIMYSNFKTLFCQIRFYFVTNVNKISWYISGNYFIKAVHKCDGPEKASFKKRLFFL